MSDSLLIKTNEKKLLSHFRVDQDYSDLSTKVDALITQFHPGKTASAYALVDAEDFQVAVEGKEWVPGLDCEVNGDFNLVAKEDVLGTETIIPPAGMTEGELADTDICLCYTT